MTFAHLQAKFPRFVTIANHFEARHGLFMAKPLLQLRESEPDYAFAEKLCEDAYALCGGDEQKLLENADTMVEFSLEFLLLQRELEKTGRYKYTTFQEVDEQVYRNPDLPLYGPPYIWAMYFTQAFWVSHCRVWRFFLAEFAGSPASPSGGSVMEIPSGNGLFLTHFLLQNPSWKGVALDLSEVSIEFSDRMLSLNGVRDRVDVKKEDFFRYAGDKSFDRIICGEFLEHVEDPLSVLVKLRTLLRPDGRLFLTAAVWAANIDHIYLYKSAQEVRDHIRAAGLEIERELVQNVFANKQPEDERTAINYSAILKPQSSSR